MRRRWAISAALAAATTASLLVAPAPQAAAKTYTITTVQYVVETRHADIFVQVAHPTNANGDIVKAPAILTYSPYSILGAPPDYRRNNDADRWVPRGYARVWADVVGTGNSGGCYDYGGERERESGYDIVEWIAKQKWSTGKVAMIGGSYEGTTATATAVENPPHLTTIVPEAAISRWYGYAYSGGIRYFLNNESLSRQGPGAVTDEGFDTPLAFDFGLAMPPPLDAGGPGWAERVQSAITPCEELEHTQHGYDDTPDYDDFWKERDYLLDADKIDIPVLVAHNWGDWNVKQEEGWNLYNALDNSPKKVMYFGTRWSGHGTPAGDYDKTVDAWMDHYLMGEDNDIEKMPSVVSQVSDDAGPVSWYKGKAPKTTNVTLYLQQTPVTGATDYQWKLLPTKPDLRVFGMLGPQDAKFPSTNINTEAHALHHGRSNHDWIWFEGLPFKKDTRIFGEIKLQIWSHTARKWVTVTPSLADVNPDCHTLVGNQHVLKPECGTNPLVAFTRGWLDSRYRNGLAKQEEITPNKSFGMTIALKPVDYVIRAGHYLGLNIQTEINEWSLPKIYPCDSPACPDFYVDWKDAKTRLIVPVVGNVKNPMDLFDMHHGH